MIMKYILSICLLLSLAGIAKAQVHVAFQEDCQKAIQRELLVKIYDPEAKNFKGWSEEEIADYKAYISDYNELVKLSFKKYWKAHSQPLFKTPQEINVLVKEGGDKYAVFTYVPFESSNVKCASDADNNPYKYSIYLTKKGKMLLYSAVSFSVAKAETEMEFKFLLRNMNKYLLATAEGKEYRDTSLYDMDKNLQILKQKTLLFDEAMLNMEKVTKEQAAKTYRYKLEFSSPDEIYKAIEREDSTVLFLSYIFNNSHGLWVYAIIDPSTMNVICMQAPARAHFSVGSQYASNTSMHQKALKYGGTPYSHKEPFTIWRAKVIIALNEKDLRVLGSEETIRMGYESILNRY